MKRNNFYVYQHLTKDDTVFYVGKGTGDRCYRKTSRSKQWGEFTQNNDYDVKIIQNDLSEEQAYEIEQKLIKEIGRLDKNEGTLLNGSDGGMNITMTREEKCQYLIDKGYTYNPITGEVTGKRGWVLKNRHYKNYLVVKNSIPHFSLFQHQFAWYWVHKETVDCIDHINGIRTDNRIKNLRSVTNQQNQFNTHTVKGYSWNKLSNKWVSQIRINGKIIFLGSFITEDEAKEAYLKAKEKYHKFDGSDIEILRKKEIKGYYWDRGKNKWKSQITINGKRNHLGFFTTEIEAKEAYLKAKEIYHQ